MGATNPGPAGAWQEEEEEESKRAVSVLQAARRAWLTPALKSAAFTPSSLPGSANGIPALRGLSGSMCRHGRQ